MTQEKKLLKWLGEMGSDINHLYDDEDGPYIMYHDEGEEGEDGWIRYKEIRVPNEYL